jgi:hypothetical protein
MSTARDFTAGQVLTAAQMDDLAQGRLGVGTPGTSDVGPTSGTTSLDVITCAAVTPASTNRVLQVRARWRGIVGTNSGDVFELRLQEGATVLERQNQQIEATGVGHNGGNIIAEVESPTAASHTYKLTITRVTGSGTATVQGAATYPIAISVVDIGTA